MTAFAGVVQELLRLVNPYPGLRPFETSEARAFFGRDQQVGELLTRLRRNRFLAVVGVSGSGKSSLIRAGLIPALERGSTVEADGRWRIVVTRPAGTPFQSLATDLTRARLDASALRQSSHGLIATAARLPHNESLLVVVDQFEELFRYRDAVPGGAHPRQRRSAAATESSEFVQLLLAASRHHPPVHVVITMRSDYLGDCAEFRDLPETLNDCQYLVPRLTRQQRQEAIEGPLGRVKIASSLVQRILNDAGDEPDQLPVLQHALMRTWERWHSLDPKNTRSIGLQDYTDIGGFDKALDWHADKLLEGVPIEIAATVFKRLTARGRTNREHRDPATLTELWAVCGAETPDAQARVTAVIDRFRLGAATFLSPREGTLHATDYVDITHESLIRQWRRLRDEWAVQEQESAKRFQNLVERARNWKAKKGSVLDGPDLTQAEDWNRQRNKTEAWAAHYAEPDDLGLVLELIEASRAEDRSRRWRNRGLWIAAPLALLFAALSAVAIWQTTVALQQRELAEQREGESAKAAEKEKAAREDADAALEEAKVLRQQADDAREEMQRQRDLAGNRGIVSLSRLLLAQSALARNERADLELPMLMAVESLRRAPGFDGDRVLRELAALTPRPPLSFEHPRIRAVAYGTDKRWMVAGIRDGAAWVAGLDSVKTTTGLDGGATIVAMSRNARWVAAVGKENVVRVFAADGGGAVAALAHPQQVLALAVTPDGRFVATTSTDRIARVFDTAEVKEVWTQQHPDAVNTIAISANGGLVVTGSGDRAGEVGAEEDNSARVFDRMSGKEVARVRAAQPVQAVAISDNGSRAALGSDDNTALVFAPSTGNVLWRQAHRSPVTAVALSGDGQWAASGSEDGAVRVFDGPSGREIARTTHLRPVTGVVFSLDGRLVASTADDITRVFDPTSTPAAQDIRIRLTGISAVALSSDATRMAIGNASNRRTSFLLSGATGILAPDAARVFDLPGVAEPRFEFRSPTRLIALSRDGRHIAAGSGDVTAVFEVSSGAARTPNRPFEIPNPKPIRTLKGPARVIAFSANGGHIALAGEDGTVRVTEVATGKETAAIPHPGNVLAVAFGPSVNRIVTLSASKPQAAVSPLFARLAPQQIRILDTDRRSETVVRVSLGSAALAFSRNGRRIATLTGVIDASSGKQISSFRLAAGGVAPPVRSSFTTSVSDSRGLLDAPIAIDFSDDDKRVAVGNLNGFVHVFATETGEELARIPVGGRPTAVRFTDGERRLATVTAISTREVLIARHLLRTNDLIDEVCARITRKLTEAEWAQYVGKEVPYSETCPGRR